MSLPGIIWRMVVCVGLMAFAIKENGTIHALVDAFLSGSTLMVILDNFRKGHRSQ